MNAALHCLAAFECEFTRPSDSEDRHLTLEPGRQSRIKDPKVRKE